MLLTNSKQIVLSKMEECSTFELLSDVQPTEDDHDSTRAKTNHQSAESQLQRKVREMEESIFEEATEIFKLLNESNALTVDGLTYREIQQSQQLANTLHQIRGNAPIYQHLDKRKKTKLMNEIGLNYMAKLNKCEPFICQNSADQHKNQSQNQFEAANLSPKAIVHKSSTIKSKPVRKRLPKVKNGASNQRHTKKIRFSSVSFCKYFCSLQAPKRIRQSEINSMQTF